MKNYINPTCDIIDVATDEVMTNGMSVRIFDQNADITGNDIKITNSYEILSNHSKLWDDEEEEESWK